MLTKKISLRRESSSPPSRLSPATSSCSTAPIKHALELDAKFLLSLDARSPARWYRKEAGLEPKAEVYGGWESQGIAGHSLGHYLSACARMYRATGDEEFRKRVELHRRRARRMPAGRTATASSAPCPTADACSSEVSRGDIRSQGFDLNGSWVPWYNLHKLFAGLIDAYRYCDNEQAQDRRRRGSPTGPSPRPRISRPSSGSRCSPASTAA